MAFMHGCPDVVCVRLDPLDLLRFHFQSRILGGFGEGPWPVRPVGPQGVQANTVTLPAEESAPQVSACYIRRQSAVLSRHLVEHSCTDQVAFSPFVAE